MDRLPHNIRVGIRSLSRTPGFSVTAILSLALGIGLSTAVFTVADALLRRLPVHDQDRLVVLSGELRDRGFGNYPLGLADAREFARRSRSLAPVAFFAYEGAAPVLIRDGDRISWLGRVRVSGEFFDVLGARPALDGTWSDRDRRAAHGHATRPRDRDGGYGRRAPRCSVREPPARGDSLRSERDRRHDAR
jgi:putative ABC transport system permease protein